MKGNKLIATSIASAMLVAGMAMPALAVDSATEVRYSEKYVSSPAIAIDLRNGESELTREKLATLVSDRYHTTLVSVKNANGETITSSSAHVGTGSIANLNNGKTVTVVLYGDINKDGAVDLVDAQAIYNNYHVTSLPAEQAKAAELTGDSNIDFVDAQRAFNYASPAGYTGLVADLDRLPNNEEMKAEYKYTARINENNVINNVNSTDTTLTVSTSKDLESGIRARLYIVDPTTKKESVLKTASKDSTGELKGSREVYVDLQAHQYENISFQYDFSTLISSGKVKQGTNIARIYNNNNSKPENLLTEFTFEVHTTEIDSDKLANIVVDRYASHRATVSFDSYGESEVDKLYYTVGDNLANFDEANKDLEEYLKDFTLVDLTDGSGSATVELDDNGSQNLYYVLLDEYGSISDVLGPVVIPTDGTVTTAREVANITVPDLSKCALTSDAEFSWEFADKKDVNGEKFTVTLYKDDEIINEVQVDAPSSGKTTTATLDNLLGSNALTPGTYKIKVRTSGSASSYASEGVVSETITVEELKAVSNIQFNYDGRTKTLTWDSQYDEGEIKGYTVNVYSYNSDSEEYDIPESQSFSNPVEEKSVNINIDENKLYKATIKVTALENQLATVATANSEAESNEFFIIKTTTITKVSATTNTVTLKINPQISLNGKTTKYSVEVYTVTGEDGNLLGKYSGPVDTQSVAVDKDGKFTVKGLNPNTEYAFVVIAEVEGATGKSGFVEADTLEVMPSITNLSVVKSPAKAADVGETQIAVINNNLVINGKTYTEAQYGSEIATICNIVNTLENTDVITYTSDKVSIELNDRKSNREFRDTLKGMKVELKGNSFDRTVYTDSDSDEPAAPKEVIISGGKDDAVLDISELNVATDGRIVLTDNVKVETDSTHSAPQHVVVASGESVTVNNTELGVSTDTELYFDNDSSSTTLYVLANTTNNLTVTAKNLAIVVKGETDYTSTQNGSIKLTANGGTVSLKGDNVHVASKLTVVATAGTVDISDETLGGEKVVTISGNGTKLIAMPAESLPSDVTAVSGVTLKTSYGSDEKLTEVTGLTESNRANVESFLTSFGISESAKATLSMDIENNVATITLNGNVKNVSVSGLYVKR